MTDQASQTQCPDESVCASDGECGTDIAEQVKAELDAKYWIPYPNDRHAPIEWDKHVDWVARAIDAAIQATGRAVRAAVARDIRDMPTYLGDAGWAELERRTDEAGYPRSYLREMRNDDRSFATSIVEAAYQSTRDRAAKIAEGSAPRPDVSIIATPPELAPTPDGEPRDIPPAKSGVKSGVLPVVGDGGSTVGANESADDSKRAAADRIDVERRRAEAGEYSQYGKDWADGFAQGLYNARWAALGTLLPCGCLKTMPAILQCAEHGGGPAFPPAPTGEPT